MLQEMKKLFCALTVLCLLGAIPLGFSCARAEEYSRTVTVEEIGLTYYYYAQNDSRWEREVYRKNSKGKYINSIGNAGCQYIAYITAFDMMGYAADFSARERLVIDFLDYAMEPDRSEPYKLDFVLTRLSNYTGRKITYGYRYFGYKLEETLAVIKRLTVGAYAMPFISDIYNTDGRASHGKGSAITSTGHYVTIIGHTLDEAGEVAYLYLSDSMYRPDYDAYLASYQKSQDRLEKKERKTYEKRHGYTPQQAFDIVQPGVLRITPAQLAEYFNYNQGSLLVWGENIARLDAIK